MNDRIWKKGDLLAGLFAGLVSFAVYAWTVAPNVTLLDSGEFTVAAQHFGVPHPTGYQGAVGCKSEKVVRFARLFDRTCAQTH